MKNPSRLTAAILLSMFLFGCGQSGPLYVTGNPSAVDPSAEQSNSEEEDEREGESSAGE